MAFLKARYDMKKVIMIVLSVLFLGNLTYADTYRVRIGAAATGSKASSINVLGNKVSWGGPCEAGEGVCMEKMSTTSPTGGGGGHVYNDDDIRVDGDILTINFSVNDHVNVEILNELVNGNIISFGAPFSVPTSLTDSYGLEGKYYVPSGEYNVEYQNDLIILTLTITKAE